MNFRMTSSSLPRNANVNQIPYYACYLNALMLKRVGTKDVNRPNRTTTLLIRNNRRANPKYYLGVYRGLFRLLQTFRVLPGRRGTTRQVLFRPLPFYPNRPYTVELSAKIRYLSPRRRRLPRLFPRERNDGPFLGQIGLNYYQNHSHRRRDHQRRRDDYPPSSFSRRERLLFLSI